MALNAPDAPAGKASGLAALGSFLAPAYVVSLILIFAGERTATSTQVQMALTGIGALGAIATTVLRFLWASRHEGNAASKQHDRRSAERILGVLQVLGLIALGLYFLTTESGKNLIGIASAEPEERARFESAMMVAWVSVLFVALLPLFLGELALAPMRRAPQPEVRRVYAALSAAFSLAFVVVYSTLFTYAGGKVDAKVDFSYFRTSRPSDSTRKIVDSATETVKISAFFPQLNEVGNEVEEYMKELAARSPKLEYKRYDRLLAPALAKELRIAQDGAIVFQRGKARDPIFLPPDMTSAAPSLRTLDIEVQKALLKVIRAANVAHFTVDHGEMSAEEDPTGEGKSSRLFRKVLDGQNYAVKDLTLATGLGKDIPRDATVLVVLGPTKPFMPTEIEVLKRYRDRGGRLLLALDPESKVDLQPLADLAGLNWSRTLIAHEKIYLRQRHNASDRNNLVTNRFSSHPSMSTLGRNTGKTAVRFMGASGLTKQEGTDFTIDYAVKSLADSFSDDNGDLENQGTEKRGSFNLAVAVTKVLPLPAGSKETSVPEFRAFVTSDADVFSDDALGNEPNKTLVVDMFRWLDGEESFAGALNSTEDVRVEHTRQGDQVWFYTTIIGVPALLLGIGLLITRRARNVRRPSEKTA